MDKASRALFAALQHRKGPEEVKPLITPEAARTPDNYYQLKPLFWALSYGASTEVLKLLLEADPEAASEVHPTEGWTPLHYAERLDADAVKLLLERCPGAAAVEDANGLLPLHWAAEHCAPPDVVRLLLEANKAAAFKEDAWGRLPVRLAVDSEAGEELLGLLRSANPSGAATALPAAPREESLPIGLLFPGQGSQYVRMMEVVKDLPSVQEMLREANSILGYDLLQVCLEGPEERLQETLTCQPAMYVAGLAGLERLRAEMPEAARRFQAVAGLSLGEYTALTAAGVFSFGDGLRLVRARAEAMHEAATLCPQALLSVAGLDEAKVLRLCAQAAAEKGPGEVCQISDFLFQRGFMIAGTKAAVERCRELCEKAKALQARLIKASGGFHTSLMAPARTRMEATLQEMVPKMSAPRCKVFLNVDARAIDWETEPQKIVDKLALQLTSPVLWKDCVTAMIADGVQEFYELGPMNQLKAMMKRIDNAAWARTSSFEV